MDLGQVERFMAEMGVSGNPANVAAVIRFVQQTEGRFDCFGNARGYCDQERCAWRRVCVKDAAVVIPAGRSRMGARDPRLLRGMPAPSCVESEQPILPTP